MGLGLLRSAHRKAGEEGYVMEQRDNLVFVYKVPPG